MPRLNDLDCTRAVRAWERAHGSHVPIVAMTASVMPEDRARCMEAGMDGYLTKPIDRKRLADVLAAVRAGTGLE
jgi:CheY-like chemotaxis protein